MKEQKTEKLKSDWGFATLGAMMVVVGAIMICQGFSAYKTGAIIPATTKTGPLTGLHSIIIGVITGVTGLSFVGAEVYKAMQRKGKNSNEAARPDR